MDDKTTPEGVLVARTSGIVALDDSAVRVHRGVTTAHPNAAIVQAYPDLWVPRDDVLTFPEDDDVDVPAEVRRHHEARRTVLETDRQPAEHVFATPEGAPDEPVGDRDNPVVFDPFPAANEHEPVDPDAADAPPVNFAPLPPPPAGVVGYGADGKPGRELDDDRYGTVEEREQAEDAAEQQADAQPEHGHPADPADDAAEQVADALGIDIPAGLDVSNRTVRAWARDRGFDMPARGVPDDVMRQYVAVQVAAIAAAEHDVAGRP